MTSGEYASLSHVRKIVGHYMGEEEKHARNPTEADVDEEGWPRGPSAARCPACGGELLLRRIDDLRVVEFEGRCEGCGWSGPLRELRCGGCHGSRLFEWTGEAWRCLRYGHIRGPLFPDQIGTSPEGREGLKWTEPERLFATT